MLPEKGFSEVLSVGRLGDSGETVAFNKEGLLASKPRFESQIRELGLLSGAGEVEPILNLALSDPGVNFLSGVRPATI